MDPILGFVLEHGLTPVGMLGVFLWLYIKKDTECARKDVELKAERDARINDSKDFTSLALKLQGQGQEQTQKLRETFDELRKLYPPNPRRDLR